MAIEAKHIQVFLCRFIKFSIDILCKIVQKHPIVSSAVLFLFILYLFLPRLFIILIYSSPLLACAFIYIRYHYWPSRNAKIENDKKEDRAVTLDEQIVSRNYSSVATISQRNVKEKNKELDLQTAKEDSIGKTVIIEEEKPGGGEGEGGSICRSISIGENVGGLSFTSLDGLEERTAKAEMENSSSDEEEEEEEEEKSTNQAVEWTEDDQQNLMDLGISELERNKRLESLIARRRARKLCKMNTEKISIQGNSSVYNPVVPVLVARGNPFGSPTEADEKIPGSAPSKLFSNRNPFDIPYDPLEEKPDLMADSFQQEFMETNLKEMLFCRHESFTWGPSFPFEAKLNDPDISGHSNFKKDHEDEEDQDWLVEHVLDRDDKALRRSLSITDLVTEESESSNQVEHQPEEDGEADIISRTEIKAEKIETTAHPGADSSLNKGDGDIRHNRSESSLSSLSDENESTIKPKKTEGLSNIQPPTFKFPDIANSSPTNSDPCPLPKARIINETCYIASPSTIDRSRIDNHLLYTNNGPWHTPTNSIASDMQVEVSEVGSPPLTGDVSASSSDGDSLTYDGDIEKEITSGSDEMWGISPHSPKSQEHEMASTEVNEFSRDDIAQDFSGFHTKPEALFASSSRSSIPQDDNPNSDNRISSVAEQPEENLQKPQESLNPFEKTAEEADNSYTVDVPTENRHGGTENSINLDLACDVSKLAGELNSESSKHTDTQSLDNPMQSVKEMDVVYNADDEAVHPTVTKEYTESKEEKNDRIDRYIEQEVVVDLSKRAKESISESGMSPESNSDNPSANLSFSIQNQEQGSTKSEVSGVTQSCHNNNNNPSTSSTQPEMAVEQASTISSASSSPKSVLPDRIPLAETSSDLNQHMQMEVMEERMDRDKLLDEQSTETLVIPSNQNAQHVTEDSTNHPSIDAKEETSDTLEMSTDESREMSNLDEHVLHDGETTEDPKSVLTTHAKSEASSSDEAAVELSKPHEEIIARRPSEEINSRTIEAALSPEEFNPESIEADVELSRSPEEINSRSIESALPIEEFNPRSIEAALTIEEFNPRSIEADVDLSRPPEEINSRSNIEQFKGSSENMTEYEARIDQPKSEIEHDNSEVLGLAVTQEETSDTSGKSTDEMSNLDEYVLVEGETTEENNSSSSEAVVELPGPPEELEEINGGSIKAVAELSSPLEEISSRSVEQFNDTPENLIEHEATIDDTKSEMKDNNSNLPGLAATEEEMSATIGKSTDESREMSNLNEHVVDGGETTEASNSVEADVEMPTPPEETIEAAVELPHEEINFRSIEAAVEMSRPPEEINSRSIEQINDTSENLTQCEPIIDQPKSETEKSSQVSTQDADGNSVAATEHRTATVPSNPAVESVHEDMLVNVGAEEPVLQQNPLSPEDGVANDRINNDRPPDPVGVGEHEFKQLDRILDTSEQSNIIENPTSGSTQVTETGSRNFTEDAVNNVQLQPTGERSHIDNAEAAQREGIDRLKLAVEEIKAHDSEASTPENQ